MTNVAIQSLADYWLTQRGKPASPARRFLVIVSCPLFPLFTQAASDFISCALTHLRQTPLISCQLGPPLTCWPLAFSSGTAPHSPPAHPPLAYSRTKVSPTTSSSARLAWIPRISLLLCVHATWHILPGYSAPSNCPHLFRRFAQPLAACLCSSDQSLSQVRKTLVFS